MNASSPVAVIDVGSNTIKLLVARRSAQGGLDTVLSRTIDARISRGISHASPVLGEEGVGAGLKAVADLVAAGRAAGASSFVIVATSAVRGARNGAEFAARVEATTGFPLRVLSGDEEANLIGRGLLTDPGLGDFRDFYVFDLGGGSLECLYFRNKQIAAAISLPLGCVRLTERFVANPAAPVAASVLDAVSSHARAELAASGFPFGAAAPAVFAGGTMTTARAIRAAADGRELMESPREVTRAELARLLGAVSALPLEHRRTDIKGLPATRADVFPAALATMLAVAEVGRFDSFTHSFYNLRYGIAADLLGRDPVADRARSAPAAAD
ncbi:guanosine-5'-triphosphate,3'-diphosphate pyrophosphatase [mine drainage metagenome]|uniref:Guanosine-5'-triphosphate,3'-diphosphate pyrophosphatase n=1 Tax=mine drainage metagenome TaxID=410659 RepID=A0A1J5SZX1_9ZZZZ